MTRKIILGNGEWAYYEKTGVGTCTVTLSDLESHSSKDFFYL